MQADLDLGNYERWLDITLSRDNNITTGKIYQVRPCDRAGACAWVCTLTSRIYVNSIVDMRVLHENRAVPGRPDGSLDSA